MKKRERTKALQVRCFVQGRGLKIVLNGRPKPEVAQSLDIEENLIYKWKSRNNTKEQTPTAVSKVGNVTSPPAWQDQSELPHKRIRELEGERNILKKR